VSVVVGVISPRFADIVFNGVSVGINVVFCVVMGISPRYADMVDSVSSLELVVERVVTGISPRPSVEMKNIANDRMIAIV